ncbi:hypothetical protein BOTBODRAFT_55515 [Botryobasidium botryosum FD-172 SS1]|uniref:MYND-type domain-containing protein n=1 Tax=Botryobasidium botryosum (strain FD-172 SS1) TaxID=930990 RepID=A0A067MI51_BOTB1|nr:hypothetical protein BOTBODRAFT_55515 [Botryobasidium botryosum FD-172 SS1]
MSVPAEVVNRLTHVLSCFQTDHGSRKASRHHFRHTCSFCGKENNTGLKLATCARCRSVRYCNVNCQRAHYRACHKADCESFKDPPIGDLFDTRNRPGTKYPINPVFAKNSDDGLGCWVSVGENPLCHLQTILCPTTAFPYRQEIATLPETKAILEKQEGTTKNILTLRVLVQNRRKDRAGVMILSTGSYIMSAGSEDVDRTMVQCKALKYWKQLGDDVFDVSELISRDITLVCARPYRDPWGVHRASVLSINGSQYDRNTIFPRSSSPPSSPPLHQIRDPACGVVALQYGDHAVLELQFRCTHAADGEIFTTEFGALLHLAAFGICYFTQGKDEHSILSCLFDRDSIKSYYADYFVHGVHVHLDSHYADKSVPEKFIEPCVLEKIYEVARPGMMDQFSLDDIMRAQEATNKIFRGADSFDPYEAIQALYKDTLAEEKSKGSIKTSRQ